MKYFACAVLCCAALSGCKEKEPVVVEHQHSASCSHAKQPVTQEPQKPQVVRRSMLSLSEDELQKFIQNTKDDDMISSYMLYQYYLEKGNQAQADYWDAQTRRILETKAPDDPEASKLRSRLGLSDSTTNNEDENTTMDSEPEPVGAALEAPDAKSAVRNIATPRPASRIFPEDR